ncbi:hypothetical protein KDJ21_016540 [Metabacillus litoralis]|uniref:hypothetical protein n=1 Tax=Metabacillus TaxID=2675233 RepID=UPI000EF56EC3|nr:hypothetical protein [Metabacillus litoralis]MCM3163949.1 hypothetical protein [Metabacillus litoralis]MCM3410445.1 hypothetical protein [Metabacillus litoralis]UHA58458.1 hypothetical protein KDJ21_016540 [Metabacillus litoralis]
MSYSSPFVQFDAIKVYVIDTNSGIFVGTNTQLNWTSSSDRKNGFGSIYGNFNKASENFILFKDDDVIDTPINRR